MSLKFFYNGIKSADAPKLQKCYYSSGYNNRPEGTIMVWGKHYKNFSPEVSAALKIIDGTDLMTDYFENQHIIVEPTHPLYAQVKEAYEKQIAHQHRLRAKRDVTQ